MSGSGLDYLLGTGVFAKKDSEKKAIRELRALFDEVARVADQIGDADAKRKLKAAAATGKEKLKLV